MSSEENKATTRRYIEEPWNHGNFAVYDEVCAPTYQLSGARTAAELAADLASLRTSFPNLQMTIEEMIAEGDTVAFRWTARGTQQGEFQGIAPTGKAVLTTGITILHFADGKIVDDRFESGSPDLKDQLA